MIELRQVTFSYRRSRPVLSEVSLELGPGLTLVLGPNGAGKSTLLRLTAGVERPDGGRVLVDGLDLWEQEVAARERLAYLPEHPDLSPYATIGDVLALVARLRGEPSAAGAEMLEALGLGLETSASVRELSLGQRRRALLAAAMIGTPTHLLLDEPLEALDRAGRELVLSWLRTRIEAGATALVVSHQIEPFLDLTRAALEIGPGKAKLHIFETPPPLADLDRMARGAAPLR